MREERNPNRIADLVARTKSADAPRHEVAAALFTEHLDLAAIRLALGRKEPIDRQTNEFAPPTLRPAPPAEPAASAPPPEAEVAVPELATTVPTRRDGRRRIGRIAAWTAAAALPTAAAVAFSLGALTPHGPSLQATPVPSVATPTSISTPPRPALPATDSAPSELAAATRPAETRNDGPAANPGRSMAAADPALFQPAAALRSIATPPPRASVGEFSPEPAGAAPGFVATVSDRTTPAPDAPAPSVAPAPAAPLQPDFVAAGPAAPAALAGSPNAPVVRPPSPARSETPSAAIVTALIRPTPAPAPPAPTQPDVAAAGRPPILALSAIDAPAPAREASGRSAVSSNPGDLEPTVLAARADTWRQAAAFVGLAQIAPALVQPSAAGLPTPDTTLRSVGLPPASAAAEGGDPDARAGAILAAASPVPVRRPGAADAAPAPLSVAPVTDLAVRGVVLPPLAAPERPSIAPRPDLAAPSLAAVTPQAARPATVAALVEAAPAPAPVVGPRARPVPEPRLDAGPVVASRDAASVTAASATPAGDAPPAATPASARLVIHYSAFGAALDRPPILAALAAAGFARVEWREVPFDISASNARYFYAGDRTVTAQAAAALGGAGYAADARDFTHYAPTPSPGTVELWLAR